MNDDEMNKLPDATPDLAGGGLGAALEQVRRYVDQSVAENTRRAYAADWRHFEGWCTAHALEPLPAAPETVAAYLSALADGSAAEDGAPYAAATIRRRRTSIRIVHGAGDPTDTELVQKTWRGIRRDENVRVDQEGREALLPPHSGDANAGRHTTRMSLHRQCRASHDPHITAPRHYLSTFQCADSSHRRRQVGRGHHGPDRPRVLLDNATIRLTGEVILP
jgi:hypothetical protein